MSYYDVEDAMEEFEEADCPYGFEFCSDPWARDHGLCTTECDAYYESLEEVTEKRTKEVTSPGQDST